MEYFEELLKTTGTPSLLDAESGALGSDSPISGAKVIKVVKMLLSGKDPMVDSLDFLKALNVMGLCWLTRLCSIA